MSCSHAVLSLDCARYKKERWPSGLRYLLGKQAYEQSYRGFESPPFRQRIPELSRLGIFLLTRRGIPRPTLDKQSDKTERQDRKCNGRNDPNNERIAVLDFVIPAPHEHTNAPHDQDIEQNSRQVIQREQSERYLFFDYQIDREENPDAEQELDKEE